MSLLFLGAAWVRFEVANKMPECVGCVETATSSVGFVGTEDDNRTVPLPMAVGVNPLVRYRQAGDQNSVGLKVAD